MRYQKNLIWLSFLLIMQGCASLKPLSLDTRALASRPQYWLTTSMYSGFFYDNPELKLMDYRPFSAIDDAKTLDGAIIYPPEHQHIIPAGSLVQIVDISYPSGPEKLKRALYSPRENIWVYFKVARERGLVSHFYDRLHVLIVPQHIQSKDELKIFLNKFLSTHDPNTWVLKARSYIQEGIWNKKALIGMSKRELYAALGPALKMQHQKLDDERPAELWHYANYFVVIQSNEVVKVKNLLAKK